MWSPEHELAPYRLYPNDERETVQAPTSSKVYQRARIRLPSALRKPSLGTHFDWDDSRNEDYAKRPVLLDAFSGAGGSALGYYLAGFRIVGVDHLPQPRFPFAFILADALEYVREHGHEYDAIHASPPCQAYSRLRHLPWLRGRHYPRLIGETREALIATRKFYVIENLSDAPVWGAELCGAALGLPFSRHRRFECSVLVMFPPCPGHDVIQPGSATLGKRYRTQPGITGMPKEISRDSMAGHFAGVALAREAMQIPWMTRDELSQAIPPAYTHYLGLQLIKVVRIEDGQPGKGTGRWIACFVLDPEKGR